MKEILFWTILIMGMPVLFSYFMMYYNIDSYDGMWGGLTGNIFKGWMAIMILAVISHFVLAYEFIWGDMEHETILCIIYIIFFSSATQWSYISMLAIEHQDRWLNRWMVHLNVVVTSLGAIGILIMAILTEKWYAITAGVIYMGHHLVMDTIIWNMGFLNPEERIVRNI